MSLFLILLAAGDSKRLESTTPKPFHKINNITLLEHTINAFNDFGEIKKTVIVYNKKHKKYLNKKSFPYSEKINFNSIRKGEIVGNHKVLFSSGKETVTLNHEAFDRALYSEGAFTAAKWLMSKKPGLYSMRNVLNFK